MKHLHTIIFLGLFTLLFSCQDDNGQHISQTKRIAQQKDSALKALDSYWRFDIPTASPRVAAQVANWQEWKLYLKELSGKPTASLKGYRNKAKDMVLRVEGLQNNVPTPFNRPEVRTRANVLITKVHLLSSFINTENIPTDRVIDILSDIADETALLQSQFDELVRRDEIPKERGEEEMIRALDTVRMANPEMMNPSGQNQQPRPSYQTGGQHNP